MGIIMALLAMVIIPMDWVLPIFGLDFRPWRLFLICTSLLNLWNGIVLSFLPETPKFLLAMNEKEEALKVLQKIYAYNTGEPKEVIEIWLFLLIEEKSQKIEKFT